MVYGIGITLEDINSNVSGYILIKKEEKKILRVCFLAILMLVLELWMDVCLLFYCWKSSTLQLSKVQGRDNCNLQMLFIIF